MERRLNLEVQQTAHRYFPTNVPKTNESTKHLQRNATQKKKNKETQTHNPQIRPVSLETRHKCNACPLPTRMCTFVCGFWRYASVGCVFVAGRARLFIVRTYGPAWEFVLVRLAFGAPHTHTHLCLLFWRSKTRCRVIAPAEDAVRKLRYVCDGQNRNRSPPPPPSPALRGHLHIEQHAYLWIKKPALSSHSKCFVMVSAFVNALLQETFGQHMCVVCCGCHVAYALSIVLKSCVHPTSSRMSTNQTHRNNNAGSKLLIWRCWSFARGKFLFFGGPWGARMKRV